MISELKKSLDLNFDRDSNFFEKHCIFERNDLRFFALEFTFECEVIYERCENCVYISGST